MFIVHKLHSYMAFINIYKYELDSTKSRTAPRFLMTRVSIHCNPFTGHRAVIVIIISRHTRHHSRIRHRYRCRSSSSSSSLSPPFTRTTTHRYCHPNQQLVDDRKKFQFLGVFFCCAVPWVPYIGRVTATG